MKEGILQGWLERSRQEKFRKHKEWDLCINMVRGNHYVHWNQGRNTWDALTPSSNPKAKNRVTFNLTLNYYKAEKARLALASPAIACTPASDQTEDILKARASEFALRHYWQTEDIRYLSADLMDWLVICGSVGLHAYYDAALDRVRPEVVSPYDLFFEPGVNDWRDSRFVAIRRYATRDELEKLDQIPKAAIDALPPATRESSNESNDGLRPEDRLEYFEVYFMDGSGKKGLFGGGKWMWQGETGIDSLPFQFIRHTAIVRDLWGLGMVAPIIGVQLYYNRARNRILDSIELMADPTWMVHKQSGIPAGAISNTPGKVIHWAGPVPPSQTKGAELPQYVTDNINRLPSEMMDIVGLHSTSLGKRAVGVTSGRAINELSDQDSAQRAGTQLNIERGFKAHAEAVLQLMKAFYTEPRWVRMFDDAGQVISQQVSQTDYVGVSEVIIQPGSFFQHDAETRERRLWELVQMQAIDPQTAMKESTFRVYNVEEMRRMKGLSHARELLTAAILGFEIEVFASDDLEAFVEVFSEYIQSPAFYKIDDERQRYIRDMLVSFTTAGAPPAEYAAALENQDVWPRSGVSGAQAVGSLRSQQAAEQAADEAADREGREESAEDFMARRTEGIQGAKIGGATGGLG